MNRSKLSNLIIESHHMISFFFAKISPALIASDFENIGSHYETHPGSELAGSC